MTTYIALPNTIEAFVVVNDAVNEATVVGVEIDGEDQRLIAVVNSGVSITARRFKEVYPDELYAELELQNRITDRKLIERLDAEGAERERLAVATGT
jgi:hypothetical protein